MSEGDTKQEALKNIKEAIQGYLEALPEEVERLKFLVAQLSPERERREKLR
jgi:predicted RNase H-like HicB family nuclease